MIISYEDLLSIAIDKQEQKLRNKHFDHVQRMKYNACKYVKRNNNSRASNRSNLKQKFKNR